MSQGKSTKDGGAAGGGRGGSRSEKAETFDFAGLEVKTQGKDLRFLCRDKDDEDGGHEGDEDNEVVLRDKEGRIILICRCVNGVWKCRK